MNNRIQLKLTLFLLLSLISFGTANAQITNSLPEPKIKVGMAKISGSITNLKLPKGEKLIFEIKVSNPVSGELSNYSVSPNANNRFSIAIPLECNKTIVSCCIATDSMYYWSGLIGLDQDKDLQINFVFDAKENITVDVKGGLDLIPADLQNILIRFEEYHEKKDNFYKMTPTEFAHHELNVALKDRINYALDSLKLSPKIKKYLINSFNICFIKGRLFTYKDDAEKSYRDNVKDSTDFKAMEPDKSYYSFLKQYDLNDPQLLYTYYYFSPEFLQRFRAIKAFQIPKIQETPIDEWLKGVKNSVKDVVGFDSGLFYDMLAANAYTTQMNDSREPLTKKQLENIRDYYKTKNSDITEILLKKSNEIHELLKKNGDLRINPTPSVAKEKLMNTIMVKYAGKVVMVDLWATWCAPCMKAHEEMKPIKEKLKNEGVTFVYVTDTSSPKQLWEGKIKGIGGEQYYLTHNEIVSIMDRFGFDAFPTYLIYDKKGLLKYKFTGFPGNEKIKNLLEKLLK